MADLHVTRHARETEYEKRIYNTLKKPLEELNYVTSLNRDYRPKAISEHSFFYIPLRIQGKPKIDEHFRIRTSVELKNDTNSESLSTV